MFPHLPQSRRCQLIPDYRDSLSVLRTGYHRITTALAAALISQHIQRDFQKYIESKCSLIHEPQNSLDDNHILFFHQVCLNQLTSCNWHYLSCRCTGTQRSAGVGYPYAWHAVNHQHSAIWPIINGTIQCCNREWETESLCQSTVIFITKKKKYIKGIS